MSDEGGDSACWAHLLCPGCGTVLDGDTHAEDCPTLADDEGLTDAETP